MKILMVNKFLYPAGGAETYMFETGRYWKRCGFEVEYFGMRHPGNVVGNRWNLYTKSLDFHPKGACGYLINPVKLIYSVEAKKKMEELLIRFHPDVVHLNNFNYQLTPSVLEAAAEYRESTKPDLRVIYTAHDPQLVCPNHYLYRPDTGEVCGRCLGGNYGNCIRGRCIHGSALKSCVGTMEAVYWKRRKIYRQIDAIICPSFFIKEKLDTDLLLRGKTTVMCNFVRETLDCGKEKGEYVLYFGRYSEEKGIRLLLEAGKELSDIPFVFAGNGPLEKLIDKYKGGNVRNAGFLKGKALDGLIRGARFTVCPSVCNENCPFSVMESIANRTPVLGAQRGGIPELISEGKTGWLFRAGDKADLRFALRRIWDSDEPEWFAENCSNTHFASVEEYGEKLYKIYRPVSEK